MKKLFSITALIIFFSSFGQKDIERYKVYNTENIYTSLLLDSATGQIWQLQLGLNDVDQIKSVLNDFRYATPKEEIIADWEENIDSKMEEWERSYNSKPDSIVSPETKEFWKPSTLEETLIYKDIAQNGRFKLYPTDNMYNFIMVDVIEGHTFQVQWSTNRDERFVRLFY